MLEESAERRSLELRKGCTCMCVCSLASVVSDSVDPKDCSLPGPSFNVDSTGKSTGMGCHALLLFNDLGVSNSL